MSDDEVELRLGFGGRVLLVRRWAVFRRSPGSFEVSRRGGVSTVPWERVHEITPQLAARLARELSRPGAIGFARHFLTDLTNGYGDQRQRALEHLLEDSYCMIELEDHQGRWEGRAAQPSRTAQPPRDEPEIRMKPLSWVAVTVVDDAEPARPLRGLQFQMRLPDGSTRMGKLDDQGHVRVEDIESGKCWVELSDVRRGLAP